MPAEKDPKASGGKGTTQGGADAAANGASDTAAASEKGAADKTAGDTASLSGSTLVSSELPPEVRARLLKLEKLEKTYPGSHGPHKHGYLEVAMD
jgi:hypothetical protein